jgi:glycosyltransferase involved in cell wall biosynthesis
VSAPATSSSTTTATNGTAAQGAASHGTAQGPAPAPARTYLNDTRETRSEIPLGASAQQQRGLIEVMIPTLNERSHISETVRNALKIGPVFVLDSFSTDGTQELARAAGATVIEHRFENYSRQKNWGLDNLPFKGEWVFILDADERITPELADELKRASTDASAGAARGYFVNRIVIMMGRAIRFGGMLPSWNLRFFKRGSCRYEDRSVHEHMICDGPTAYLRSKMLHIRRETIGEYITKHIRYADMESDEWIRMRVGRDNAARARHLFRDLPKYRLYLRRDVWPYLPFKPFIRFVYMYFVRLGFLDGAAGWHLASLMASYEYMIKLMYEEKLQRLRDGVVTLADLNINPDQPAPAGDKPRPNVGPN